MKFVIVFVTFCFAAALAAPFDEKLALPALRHEEHHNDRGFQLEYHTADGTIVREEGKKIDGPEGEVLIKSGSYRYTSPEGLVFELTYLADHNGFQASGNHLPKAVHN